VKPNLTPNGQNKKLTAIRCYNASGEIPGRSLKTAAYMTMLFIHFSIPGEVKMKKAPYVFYNNKNTTIKILTSSLAYAKLTLTAYCDKRNWDCSNFQKVKNGNEVFVKQNIRIVCLGDGWFTLPRNSNAYDFY
jgi:hypothetical protein